MPKLPKLTCNNCGIELNAYGIATIVTCPNCRSSFVPDGPSEPIPVHKEPYCAGRSLSQWVKRLSDADHTTRREAARAIGKIGVGAKSAIPNLQKLLHDAVVSHETVLTLCKVAENGDKLETAPLISLLNKGDCEAARLLGIVRATDAVPALIKALEGPNRGDFPDDMSCRSQAAWALGQLGDERAIGPLTDVLSKSEGWSSEYSIAEALMRLGAKQPAIPVLVRIVSFLSNYSYAAASTLKECCQPSDASVILPSYHELRRQIRAHKLSPATSSARGCDLLEEVLRYLGVSEIDLTIPPKKVAGGCASAIALFGGLIISVLLLAM